MDPKTARVIAEKYNSSRAVRQLAEAHEAIRQSASRGQFEAYMSTLDTVVRQTLMKAGYQVQQDNSDWGTSSYKISW